MPRWEILGFHSRCSGYLGTPPFPSFYFLLSFLFIKGKGGRSGSTKASEKICKLPVGSLGEIGLAKPEEGMGGNWKHKGNKIK